MIAVEILPTAAFDPADSSNYYFANQGVQPTTTEGDHVIPTQPSNYGFMQGTIQCTQGTVGTDEAVSVVTNNIDGASQAIASDGWDDDAVHTKTNMGITMNYLDRWNLYFTAPAWATNPLQVVLWGTILLKITSEETRLNGIESNDSDISANSAAIAAIDVSAVSAAVLDNDSDISSNLAAILTNDSDISANVVSIAAIDVSAVSAAVLTNDSDISSNLAAILTNDSELSANLISIASNTSDNLVQDSSISANLASIAGIATNDSDISALVAEQLTQDSSISANSASIAGIATNDSDISALVAEQLTQDSSISANLAAILTNDSDISANLAFRGVTQV